MKYVFAFVTTLGILSTTTSPMAMTVNGTTEPSITAVEHPFEVAPNVPTPRSSNRVGSKSGAPRGVDALGAPWSYEAVPVPGLYLSK